VKVDGRHHESRLTHLMVGSAVGSLTSLSWRWSEATLVSAGRNRGWTFEVFLGLNDAEESPATACRCRRALLVSALAPGNMRWMALAFAPEGHEMHQAYLDYLKSWYVLIVEAPPSLVEPWWIGGAHMVDFELMQRTRRKVRRLRLCAGVPHKKYWFRWFAAERSGAPLSRFERQGI
jgi:hypothetical protein